MDYGLSRIILIDSYLPGRSYIIDLNGHTNVMGENGMGKTTLIKLAGSSMASPQRNLASSAMKRSVMMGLLSIISHGQAVTSFSNTYLLASRECWY